MMKKLEYWLRKDTDRSKVVSAIDKAIADLPADQHFDVIIKNHETSKTAAQRRLNWKWNNEVARSGIGQYNDPERVHMHAKWVFAKPLLLAGEDDYSSWVSDMWWLLLKEHPMDTERQKHFFMYAVHTEQMTPEMIAEFLKSFQYYWTSKGVRLTDPDLRGYEDVQ